MANRIRYHNPRPDAIRGDQATTKMERDRFYTSARWRKLRADFLRKNPLCHTCQARGLTTLATIVHHVKDRLLFPALAYSWANLQASCSPCHTAHHKKGPRTDA